MTPPSDESLETRLWASLALVNDWLKFAEAKNGVLLGLSGAAALGVISALSSAENVPLPLEIYAIAVAIQFIGSAAVALVSLLPQTNLKSIRKLQDPSTTDNLHYYGHIAKYDRVGFLSAFSSYWKLSHATAEQLEEALADQIITNSRITLRKMQYFSFSGWLALSALITPVVAIALYIVADPD